MSFFTDFVKFFLYFLQDFFKKTAEKIKKLCFFMIKVKIFSAGQKGGGSLPLPKIDEAKRQSVATVV